MAAKGTPELFAEYRESQGGLAFIPAPSRYTPLRLEQLKGFETADYVWRPGTDWQIAGWRRVKARDPEAYTCPNCGSSRWTCRCYA